MGWIPELCHGRSVLQRSACPRSRRRDRCLRKGDSYTGHLTSEGAPVASRRFIKFWGISDRPLEISLLFCPCFKRQAKSVFPLALALPPHFSTLHANRRQSLFPQAGIYQSSVVPVSVGAWTDIKLLKPYGNLLDKHSTSHVARPSMSGQLDHFWSRLVRTFGQSLISWLVLLYYLYSG